MSLEFRIGAKCDLSAAEVRRILIYVPETGAFYWREKTAQCVKPSTTAGSTDKTGRRVIQIKGSLYKAARLAWVYMTGEWPKELIDHINRNPGDDRWVNLRDASYQQNARNTAHKLSASGARGVYRRGSRWRATFYHNRQKFTVGTFDTREEASAARDAFALTAFTALLEKPPVKLRENA
jgi:hypothetical protein